MSGSAHSAASNDIMRRQMLDNKAHRELGDYVGSSAAACREETRTRYDNGEQKRNHSPLGITYVSSFGPPVPTSPVQHVEPLVC